MKEDGIDISNHSSNHIEEYRNIDFDFGLTFYDDAKERCPPPTGNAKRFHFNFPDPAKAKGFGQDI